MIPQSTIAPQYPKGFKCLLGLRLEIYCCIIPLLNMKERIDDSAYLEPNEQMILAAKVNRLCEVEDEEFGPENLIEAQEIVRKLDSRIQRSGMSLRISSKSKGESTVSQGATPQGEMNVSFDDEKKSEVRIGKVDEYRIGGYVVVKSRSRRINCLRFDHFFGRGETNEVLERMDGYTAIFYDDSLAIKKISRNYPIRRNFLVALVTTYAPKVLWEQGKFPLNKTQR